MKKPLCILLSLLMLIGAFSAFDMSALAADKTAPEKICVKSVNEKSAALSWRYSKSLKKGEGFEILLYSSETKAFEHLLYSDKTSATLTSLTAGTLYKIKIRTYKPAGSSYKYGEESKEFSFSTSPKGVKITSVKYASKGKAKIVWTKSEKASGYMLVYSTKKSFDSKHTNRLPVSKKRTSYKIGGLAKGKYFFKVVPFRQVNGIKYMGKDSKVKTAKTKKGASLKAMINYTKTDLSGRKEIKSRTKGDVDIKKYKTTYDRFKAIYNWYSKHNRDFTDCQDCDNQFNETINILYGDSRKYDDFIHLASGKVKSASGTNPHKWSEFFFAGKEFIIDPRMQGYNKNKTGTKYFGKAPDSTVGKLFIFKEWYFMYRGYDISVRRGEIVEYKK